MRLATTVTIVVLSALVMDITPAMATIVRILHDINIILSESACLRSLEIVFLFSLHLFMWSM